MQHDLFSSLDSFQTLSIAASTLLVRDVARQYRTAEADEVLLVVVGVFYNVQVAHLKLCASRTFWLVAYPAPLIAVSSAAGANSSRCIPAHVHNT